MDVQTHRSRYQSWAVSAVSVDGAPPSNLMKDLNSSTLGEHRMLSGVTLRFE